MTNLMAFAKNIHMNKSAMKDKFIFNFSRLTDQYLEICDNDHKVCLLKFELEEVELVLRSNHVRKYSVDLLMMSYILHATSPRACKRLLEEELLVLSSVKTKKDYNATGSQKWTGRHSVFENAIFSIKCFRQKCYPDD